MVRSISKIAEDRVASSRKWWPVAGTDFRRPKKCIERVVETGQVTDPAK